MWSKSDKRILREILEELRVQTGLLEDIKEELRPTPKPAARLVLNLGKPVEQ